MADATWRKHGVWAIDTSNPNAWNSAVSSVLPSFSADAVLLQETRLCDKERIVRAGNTSSTLGWRASLSLALKTAADVASAGCAVCVKKGIGMHPHPDDIIREGVRCRFKAVWVAGFVRGGIHLCSIYLKDSVGPSETNLNILQEAATFLSCLTGPWIIGGDWNMSPQTLASTRFPNVVHGMIVAPDLPTCNDSTYD